MTATQHARFQSIWSLLGSVRPHGTLPDSLWWCGDRGAWDVVVRALPDGAVHALSSCGSLDVRAAPDEPADAVVVATLAYLESRGVAV